MNIVSVIGAARADDDHLAVAESVGRCAAMQGFAVCSGGLGGVMESALRGAREAGGLTIGIIPGYERSAANRYCDIVIPTGMGHGRNVLIASTGTLIISVGGEYGTISELALSLKMGKPVLSYRSPLHHQNTFDSTEEFMKACTQAMEQ